MALIDFFRKRVSKKTTVLPRGNIRFFNTKTGKKDSFFLPTDVHTVKMYNCGPTVYAPPHIGNLRSYVFADTIRRVLESADYSVDQVINITDVGHLTSDADEGADKIEEGAKRSGKTAQEISTFYTTQFLDDIASLNIDTTDISFPRATDHITQQIALIQTLSEKGYTYTTKDGVYFDSSLFKNYGSLGGINITGLQEGVRIEKNPEKKHPTDFALWKFSLPEENRQQEWPSPWGVGFPGWHIECSAMSMKYLGSTIDIHTGGIDHIPTHHNNEIAQSEAATGRTFSRFWLHHEHIMIEGRKISKSLGNTITLQQIKDRGISPLAYRYFLLTGHYKTRMNFTWEALEASATALFRLRKYFVEQLYRAKESAPDTTILSTFTERMNDDMDTPRALALLWDVVKNDAMPKETKRATLSTMDEWLGLGLLESDAILSDIQNAGATKIDDSLQALLNQRTTAREQKKWDEADKARLLIEERGFTVIDTPEGPKLEKKTS